MFDVIVVGCGPAGITASTQLKRIGYKVAIFEKKVVGGLIRNAYSVENYPGFPVGISGKKLSELFKLQLESYKIPVIHKQVTKIIPGITGNNNEYLSNAVILCTGTVPKPLIINNKKLVSKKVFYEIVDIPEVTNKNIIVVGSGDVAFDYALNLVSQKANTVRIIFRGKEPKCLPLLIKKAKKCEKIDVLSQVQIYNLIENSNNICLETNVNIMKCDYLLVAIGRIPNTELINNNKHAKSIEGLYVAGDVCNAYRYVGIAVGDALKAAAEVHKYLANNKNKFLSVEVK